MSAETGRETKAPETGFNTWFLPTSFSRPWNTPRTRAQEVLENLEAVSSLKGSYKVITMADDGTLLSMKSQAKADAE